jgi:hypothetical protein
MACQINITNVGGQPGPERALRLGLSLGWNGQSPAYLLNIQGRIRVNNQVVCSSISPENLHFGGSNVADLRRDSLISGTVLAPISAESIRWIEESHPSGDIVIAVELHHAWQEAVPSAVGNQVTVGRVYWEIGHKQHRIPRSDWLQLLKELGWHEFEIFEMPLQPLLEDPNLAAAVRLLRQAQDSQRRGDPAGVLAGCYQALECAAKFHAKTDSAKQGFEALLQASMPEHEDKRAKLDALIKCLRDYCQFGRHEKYPPVRITRSEAEFVLAATVGFFCLTSRRLGKVEEVRSAART